MRLLAVTSCFFFVFAAGQLQGQKNMGYLGSVSYDVILNDIWGYESGGNEYALVGTQTGVSIVDVTNPTSPIELHFIPGDTSIWRDLKTWNDHAYVTNEKGGGLMIIDLSQLPGMVTASNWQGVDTLELHTAHNLFIDEDGFAYIFGSNFQGQGAIILDLNNDPESPDYVGLYDDRYVHDGVVRNDTLYTAEISDGEFSVIDVSDPANPDVLTRQATPNRFTHNCWFSDDGRYLYTTDERKNAFVTSYDISDLSDVAELDRYQSGIGDSVIPHNTHVLGDYLITSYYRDGVTIVDATQPHNLVEVGNYDTSPLPSAPGFEGCWGAYPYLSSGNILATDRQEGLFVLGAQYKRAGYIEGNIINSATSFPISRVKVAFVGEESIDFSNIVGDYATGTVDSGSHDLRFTHPQCQTLIVPNVQVTPGQTTLLDVVLDCDPTVGVESVKEQPDVQFSFNLDTRQLIGQNQTEIGVNYQIVNASGKVVFESRLEAESQTLEVLPLASGFYLINARLKEGALTQAIIIQ